MPTSVLREGQPIPEETEAGIVVGSALSADIGDHLDRKRTRLLASIGIGGFAVMAGIYFLLTGTPVIGTIGVLAAVVASGVGAYIHRQEPPVRLKHAEKRYWTTHLLPQADGTMVVDGTGSLSTTSFDLQYIDDHDRLQNVIEDLQSVTDLPVVLRQDGNLERTLREDLSQLDGMLSNPESRTIELPAVGRDSVIVDAIDTVVPHANRNGAKHGGGAVELPVETAVERADKIGRMETVAADADVEETFSTVKERSSRTLERITEAQAEMVDILNESVESVGDTLMMTGYNFYCPDCLGDDIYTELVPRQTAEEFAWYCETCQEDHEVERSVPVNRIKDDLVEEIWDRLWIEKDDQKRSVYEEIEDQQSELVEREFEQKQEIIRDGWNRIKDIRSKIRDLKTEARAGQGAIEEIGDVMVKYERLREERKAQFQEDVARAIDDVDEETRNVLEATRNLEQKKTEAAEKEAEQRAELRREEEQRRHREQLAAADGGLGIVGTLSSKIHKQKMKFQRKRIETFQGAEDWGEFDGRGGLAVETSRPVVAGSANAVLRGQVTGVVQHDDVGVYFEWKEHDADGGLLTRRRWTETSEQRLTAPGQFEDELTGLDPDAMYEIRAVAEAGDERYTGETLRYPNDASTEPHDTQERVEEVREQLETDVSSAETGGYPPDESTEGERDDGDPDADEEPSRRPAEILGDMFGDQR